MTRHITHQPATLDRSTTRRSTRRQGSRRTRFQPEILGLENRIVLSLSPAVAETGLISLSVDGLGTNQASGIVQVSKPAGATVRGAYMAAASTGFSSRTLANGDVSIDGVGVNWDSVVPSSIASSNAWANVTSLVKPKIDAAAAGAVDFTITEVSSFDIDGEILAVIFDDPNQTTSNTVALLFGAQNIAGDTFAIGLANPINKSDPNLALDLSLGISFGFQPTGQYSIVDVNGTRMTTSAGGQDDGESNNGALLTVGGIGDTNTNPADPFQTDSGGIRYDDELYSLLPFVNNGDTSINVFTQNPSNDDNIFFAALDFKSTTAVVGEGILLTPTSATGSTGQTQTVVATIQDDNGHPIADRAVHFVVVSGPNAGQTFDAQTDATGQASFSYTSSSGGTDVIQASFVDSKGQTVTSNQATVTWEASSPTYGFHLLTDVSGLKQSGSTVPIKIQATDASGANVSSSDLAVHILGFASASTPDVIRPAEDAGKANPGGFARSDPSLKGYIFNWKLVDPATGKGLAAGSYILYFTIGDDPAVHSVTVNVKKK
jgi:hypothetical protein